MNGFGPTDPWNPAQYGPPAPPDFFPNVSHLLDGNLALATAVPAANPYLMALPAPQFGHVGAMVERYEQLHQTSRGRLEQPSNVQPSPTNKQLQDENAELTQRLKQAEKKLAEKNASRSKRQLENENEELFLRLKRAEKRIASLKGARQENKTLSDRNVELTESVAELEKDKADIEALLETACKENEDLMSEKISNQRAQQQMHVQQYQLGDQTILIVQAAPTQPMCVQQQSPPQMDFSVQTYAQQQQAPPALLQPYPASALATLSDPPPRSTGLRHSDDVVDVPLGQNVTSQYRSDDHDVNINGDELDEFFVNHPFRPTKRARVQNIKKSKQSDRGPCENCGTTMTSHWYNGTNGKHCASCYHYNRKYGGLRPVRLHQRNIKRRNKRKD